ncbi:MAG: hypothetical protein K1X67_21615 [Fimbriimonadaceae bacterium]|nr:hypothetical protein [Fimbriimonadaceae bacterium]
MRRSRWFFAAIPVLIVAGFLVVYWSGNRPPYAFLNGSDLYFVEGPFQSGKVLCTYLVRVPLDQLVASAKKELGPENWKDGPVEIGPGQRVITHEWSPNGIVLTIYEANPAEVLGTTHYPPAPASVKAFVSVWRNPTLADHLHIASFESRWKGARGL